MEEAIASFVAAAASALAAGLANRSKAAAEKSDDRARIRQARLDERDLISKEGGFMIPIENDVLWRDYLHHLQTNKSRKEASELVSTKVPDSPDPAIGGKLMP